jgi:hypothetical protein
MAVTVSLSGEGIEFNREISESTALQIMEISMDNGNSAEEVYDEERTDRGEVPAALPDNFFRRLSDKQEALIRVLVDSGGQIDSTELQQRMSDQYDETVGGGRGIAGILAGFTRKYDEDFDLVSIEWGDGEGLYQLNPDRPEYIAEIEEHFGA